MRKLIYTLLIGLIFLNFSLISAEYNLKSNLNYYCNILENDLPVWKVGYYWNYYIALEGNPDASIIVNVVISNLYADIVSENEYSFNINISGSIHGDINAGEINGDLRDTKFVGIIKINKINLSVDIVEIKINGRLVVARIPIPFNVGIDLKCSPNYSSIEFPIFIGKQWQTQSSSINGFVNISAIFNSISIYLIAGGGNSQCIGKENISIQSGTYESFKIINTMDVNEIYYSQNVGNIIKLYGSSYDFKKISVELISTNYIEPGAPNKPEKPEGEIRGQKGNRYNYTTKTYDEENNDIYYLFDWGDGTNSNWIGPYRNYESVIASHVWSSDGNYNIKVKAKDDNNYQSPWSDALVISMAKQRNYNFIITNKSFFLMDYFL